MKILVTGGLGFIGSHIVDVLVENGHDVRVLDNLDYQVHQGRYPSHAREDVDYIIGNVLDRTMVKLALADIEIVFHEAAAVGMGQSLYQVHHYTNVNVAGTAMLLDEIVNGNHPVKKIMVAASMSSYGEGLYHCETCGDVSPPIRPVEQLQAKAWDLACPCCDGMLHPVPTPETKSLDSLAIYALNKKHQEEMFMSTGKTYGIPAVSLRYFNVYGPRQSLSNPYTGVAAIFTSRIKNENPPFIYEDGMQTRDFVHVEDVARVNLFVMEKAASNFQCINVGTGQPVSIKALAERLSTALGKTIAPAVSNEGRPGDVRHCSADTSRLARMGYDFLHPELDIEALVAWSKSVTAVDKFDQARKEMGEKLGR